MYILLEYVSGGLLFDVCKTLDGVGEQHSRFFFYQLLEVLEYMHSRGVAHRDLKLDHILLDNHMNLKISGFNFATFKNIQKLSSYQGSRTYMAPEIKEGKVYDGRQTDIFSLGVILWIITQGIFPF